MPTYQPDSPELCREPHPLRVEVTSPLRIDLAMGGISDLAPYTNEHAAKIVALCANINNMPPINCLAEVVGKPGIRFESVNHGVIETVSDWDDLADTAAPTTIARVCVDHLFFSVDRHQKLCDFIQSVFGGGLYLRTSSAAPKGLGSSSIIAAVVLQSMLRLLGRKIDWQDIVHRTVTVEHMMGVGGGWEDALPSFWGGVVAAESSPSQLPDLKARALNIAPQFLKKMESRLILFDPEQQGATGEILSEAVARYRAGDPPTLAACAEFCRIAEQVVKAVAAEDFRQLGQLLDKQWKNWKTATGQRCSNNYIDNLLLETRPWVEGAKVNGAGAGGAVVFICKKGRRDRLLSHLKSLKGKILDWQFDVEGYRVREWHAPQKFAAFIKKSLPALLKERSSFERFGEVIDCSAAEFEDGYSRAALAGPINPAIFDLIPNLAISMFGTAAALVDHVGTADRKRLKSTKKFIDAVASALVAEEIRYWPQKAPVIIAEGKDEAGKPQPTIETATARLSRDIELRTALDVVDGTTLAALGLPSAYSIGVIGQGLKPFPDLKAYAMLAPLAILDELNLQDPPEIAIEHNLKIIARALNKRIDELVVVVPSDDTGAHHRRLIQILQARGVSVIVPNPVIVESPYVVAACLDRTQTIDAMIGVFGLPETVINTVLSGLLSRGKGFVFRLVGNAAFREREKTVLDGLFDFAAAEKAEIEECGLSLDARYTIENVAAGLGGLFAGAAVTDDPLLNISGVVKKDNSVSVEGLLADPCGNLHHLRIVFERPALIDYAARYQLPIFDISLVAELDAADPGTAVLKRLEQLAGQIQNLLPDAYCQPLRQSEAGEPGLHVTLCEFIVDYVPSIAQDLMQSAFETALAVTAAHLPGDFPGALNIRLGCARRVSNGIIVEAVLDRRYRELIKGICESQADNAAFNALSEKSQHHITLARFTEVQAQERLLKLDAVLERFNKFSGDSIRVPRLFLKRAARTPFKNIKQRAVINLTA